MAPRMAARTSSLFGSTVITSNAEREFSEEPWPWQRIFYGEWDGRRRKRVIVKVLGE